jgi:hypothetical protein
LLLAKTQAWKAWASMVSNRFAVEQLRCRYRLVYKAQAFTPGNQRPPQCVLKGRQTYVRSDRLATLSGEEADQSSPMLELRHVTVEVKSID